MTAPTQQARAAILAEACHAASVNREHVYLRSLCETGDAMDRACKAVIRDQLDRIGRLTADLAKLEGEAP